MKIKLTASANINESIVSQVDIQYGFAMYNDLTGVSSKNTRNSFFMKLLSKLDKLFSIKPISEENKNKIQVIGSSIAYLNETVDKKILEDINIQINMKSLFYKLYLYIHPNSTRIRKHKLLALDTSELYITKETYMKEGIKDSEVEINNLIVLGLDKHISFMGNDVFPPEKIIQFVLFHEVSHLFDRKRSVNPPSTDSMPLSIEEEDIADNIKILKGEMYADLSAILYMRNYEIKNNSYNMKATNLFIEKLSSFRISSYDNNKKAIKLDRKNEAHSSLVRNEWITSMASIHTTSFALFDMDKVLKDIEYKILTDEEIHDIVIIQTNKGIARLISILVERNPEILYGLKTFINNGETIKTLDVMKDYFRNMSGKEWNDELNIIKIDDPEIYNDKEEILNGGLTVITDKIIANQDKEKAINNILKNHHTANKKLIM